MIESSIEYRTLACDCSGRSAHILKEMHDEVLHEIKKQHNNIVDACRRIELIEDAVGLPQKAGPGFSAWHSMSEYSAGHRREWHIESGPDGEIRRHSKSECLPACPLHLGIPQ